MSYLKTRDYHELYYASFGDPKADTILFLHGGPGGCCHAQDASLFNLDHYQVIQVDQRGCGQSRPAGHVQENNTQALVADLENLRHHLGLQRWQIYGGSWGASLALEYAKAYPERVTRLVLRGTFLARASDLAWFFDAGGVARYFPTAYAQLLAALQLEQTNTLTLLAQSYQTLLTADEQPQHAYQVALGLSNWNSVVMGLKPTTASLPVAQQQALIQRQRVFIHYSYHQFFLGGQGVLTDLARLRDLPIHLIHGQHDQVCPLAGAYTLLEYLPHAQLTVVDAGHGLHETVISEAVAQCYK